MRFARTVKSTYTDPADPEALVGQVFKFKVTEIKAGGAVVSRAALLKEERDKGAEEVRAKLQVGARLEGGRSLDPKVWCLCGSRRCGRFGPYE